MQCEEIGTLHVRVGFNLLNAFVIVCLFGVFFINKCG